MPSDLVSAYRTTHYVAFDNGRAFLVRVRHHSLVIDGVGQNENDERCLHYGFESIQQEPKRPDTRILGS
jgi:hypothetical protein